MLPFAPFRPCAALALGLALVASLPARAQGSAPAANDSLVELFVDRGDTYVRAGSNKGVKVGDTLEVVGGTIGDTQERRPVGSASVLQVWKTIARVNLDAGARSAAGEKFVQLEATPAAGAKAKAPAAGLKGRAESRMKRIIVYNDGATDWTRCDVRLPNNKHYVVPKLPAGTSEGIMSFRFTQDGTERDVPLKWVNVKCKEGEARFSL